MEFNAKERSKRIDVFISKEEHALLKAKANYYGYTMLSRYIRDAVIYEKVTNVDLEGKNEIYEAYSKNTEELRKFTKEVRHISRYATQINQEDLKLLNDSMIKILQNQKEMLKRIDLKLDLDVWKEINHKELPNKESDNHASNKKTSTFKHTTNFN